jgi:hypothetical protein
MNQNTAKLVGLFAVVIAAWSTPTTADSVINEEHFSALTPDGFKVEKTAPVEDFEIFTISRGGKAYIYVYVGNQPAFPKFKPSGNSEVTTFEAPGVSVASQWQGAALVGREILSELNVNGEFPTALHAWTAPLPPAELAVADRILFSIKTSRKQ